MEAKENLLDTMDGKRWSEEFCQRFPQCEIDDVLGWFCNAIMVGYDGGRKVGIKEVVDWVRHNQFLCHKVEGFYRTVGVDIDEWNAQLQEWGVE